MINSKSGKYSIKRDSVPTRMDSELALIHGLHSDGGEFLYSFIQNLLI